jgi:hypothetical protein
MVTARLSIGLDYGWEFLDLGTVYKKASEKQDAKWF